jgi:hypothetical protein
LSLKGSTALRVRTNTPIGLPCRINGTPKSVRACYQLHGAG